MIRRMLFQLTANLPCRLIDLDGEPYLERYYLFSFRKVTFYLHRFVSSDSERHLHNHPWGWGSALVLAGSYLEEKAVDICPQASESGCVTEMRVVRWCNSVNGNKLHRIHKAKPNTWTLFIHGPRVVLSDGEFKGWGFVKRISDRGKDASLFFPFPTHDTKWWTCAPKGMDSGRLPADYYLYGD